MGIYLILITLFAVIVIDFGYSLKSKNCDFFFLNIFIFAEIKKFILSFLLHV